MTRSHPGRPCSAWLAVGPLAMLAVSSCAGDSNPTDGTCAFASDPDNCFRTLVQQVHACLGSAVGVAGALSYDGLSCSATGAPHVVFASAVSLSMEPTLLDATIHGTSLVQCAHVVSDRLSGAITVSGPSGSVQMVMEAGGHNATVTCPSGVRHAITGASVMQSCFREAMAGGIPAVKMVHDGTSASLAFSGSPWKLYDCR